MKAIVVEIVIAVVCITIININNTKKTKKKQKNIDSLKISFFSWIIINNEIHSIIIISYRYYDGNYFLSSRIN